MQNFLFLSELSSELAEKAINEPKRVSKRFSLGNVTDPLPDKKLKGIIGGYDIDPGNWNECCFCSYSVISSLLGGKPLFGGSGWFCASSSYSSCHDALGEWTTNQCGMIDDIGQVNFMCNKGIGETNRKCN